MRHQASNSAAYPIRRTVLSLMAALMVGPAAPASTQAQAAAPVGDALALVIDSIVEEAMREGQIPGVSVAVTRGGEPVHVRGYGYADLENDVEANAETVYRIGSVTKQFTSAAIMRLVEDGKVDLQDPVSEYIHGLPAWADEVTIHQLLNHTSGVKSYTSVPEWLELMPLEMTHEEMLEVFKDKPVDFAPGDDWSYNNSGYYMLGMVIESVTDKTYGEYLEEEFYEPLDLEGTVYCGEQRLIENRAEGYVLEDGEIYNDPPIDMTQPYSAGSLCSTVVDLTRWSRLLASGEVVSPASYRTMTTPTLLNDGTEHPYAYGLFTGALEGEPFIGHGGGINGFISYLGYYPEADVAIAVLSNSQSANSSAIAEKIARQVLGLPEK